MTTTKQKKLAKVIIENSKAEAPLNKKAMLEKVGYSTSVAEAKADDIINSDGVQEELKAAGFTEENAMKVVTEIMLDSKKDANARLKATDQVFKVHGTYAPEKHITANIDVNEEHRERAINAIRNIRS